MRRRLIAVSNSTRSTSMTDQHPGRRLPVAALLFYPSLPLFPLETTPTPPADPSLIARPEDLDFDLACRAYGNTSFTPEKRARQDQESYAADVNGLHAELQKLAATEA